MSETLSNQPTYDDVELNPWLATERLYTPAHFEDDQSDEVAVDGNLDDETQFTRDALATVFNG